MLRAIIPDPSRSAWILASIALVVLATICVAHFQRRGRRRWAQALAMYGFWLYFLVLAGLIILPLPEITPDFCAVHEQASPPQLEPFDFVHDIARHSGFTRGRFSVRAMVGSWPFILAVANLAAFMPIGVYMRWFTRRGLIGAVIAGFAVSLAFEVTQGTALYGLYPCPYRHFNVDDLLLNTAGSIAGYVIVAAYGFGLGSYFRQRAGVSGQ